MFMFITDSEGRMGDNVQFGSSSGDNAAVKRLNAK